MPLLWDRCVGSEALGAEDKDCSWNYLHLYSVSSSTCISTWHTHVLLELWMISSGRSAPPSEENVGLVREQRGDGHCLFHLVAENWMVLFCILVKFRWLCSCGTFWMRKVFWCVTAKRCQTGGAWKTSLRPLGKKINVFWELAVPECGLTLTLPYFVDI